MFDIAGLIHSFRLAERYQVGKPEDDVEQHSTGVSHCKSKLDLGLRIYHLIEEYSLSHIRDPIIA